MTPARRSFQVLLDDLDITAWVTNLPKVPLQKPKWGECLGPETLQITVRNNDFAFLPYSPVSFLYNRNITEMQIIVKNYNSIVWVGYLTECKPSLGSRQSTLIADSILGQKIRNNGRIDTSEWTPAEAARKLLALHDIPTDDQSFGEANAVLDDIPCRVKIAPDVLNWAGSVGDLLRQLAVAGICRFFLTKDGEVACDTWVQPTFYTTTFEIADRIVIGRPEISDENFAKLDGYNVTYLFGNAVAGFGNVKSADFGANSAVKMTTLASADYCGTQWVALSLKKYYQIAFRLKKEYGALADLGQIVQINTPKIGMSGVYGEIVGVNDAAPDYCEVSVQIDKQLLIEY